MNMEGLLNVASKVGTPLALAGIIVIVLYALFKQVLALKLFTPIGAGPTSRFLQNVLNKLFWLALIALILGVASYILTAIFPFKSLSPNSQGSHSPNIIGNQNIVNSPYAQINAGRVERRFTAEQESSMVQELSAIPTRYAVIALEGDQEAMRFAERVIALLNRSHWQSSIIDMAQASFRGPISGVWITCGSDEIVEAGVTLARLMNANGVPTKITSSPNIGKSATSCVLNITIGHNDDMSSQSIPPIINRLSASKVLSKP